MGNELSFSVSFGWDGLFYCLGSEKSDGESSGSDLFIQKYIVALAYCICRITLKHALKSWNQTLINVLQ